jgi:formylmethanofuran dehydrogenase subunit E
MAIYPEVNKCDKCGKIIIQSFVINGQNLCGECLIWEPDPPKEVVK